MPETRIQLLTMPKWGMEMREGTIAKWHVREGDRVREGDVLVTIEAEKVVNDVESPVNAVLRRQLAAEGESCPVGALLAVFADSDTGESELDAFLSRQSSATQRDTPQGSETALPHDSGIGQPPASSSQRRASASPKAQELANRLGLDIRSVASTGPRSRVTLQDVQQHARSIGLVVATPDTPARNPYRTVKLSTARRTLAERMCAAKGPIPHFYLHAELDIDKLLSARTRGGPDQSRQPTLSHWLIKATASALMEVPQLNVHFINDEIRQFKIVNIGMAVALDDGLVAPVIRAANQKTLQEIANEATALSERARAGKLTPEELGQATFTVTNLGMIGVDSFAAIINPPQGAILAIGAVRRVAVEVDDGLAGFSSRVSVTLSCDHRAIDGALGGHFFRSLKTIVAAPERLE